MDLSRRSFFKVLGAGGAAIGTGLGTANAAEKPAPSEDSLGCLVDTTLCVGCRKCEEACNQRHDLPAPEESFEELTVLEKERRMDETSYTVVNKYYPENIGTLTWRERPTFVKFQCMHCNDPSCVSACIVGALTKEENGAVIYDAKKCIGCRYCMIACPYNARFFNFKDNEEWVNKEQPKRSHGVAEACNLCAHRLDVGKKPACVEACQNIGAGAMMVGDLNDESGDVANMVTSAAVKRIREDLGTDPKVYYIGL